MPKVALYHVFVRKRFDTLQWSNLLGAKQNPQLLPIQSRDSPICCPRHMTDSLHPKKNTPANAFKTESITPAPS